MSVIQIDDLIPPHAGQVVSVRGTSLQQAQAAMILVHGRGATAESILSLANELENRTGMAFVAPQAANNTWYPERFLAPVENNQPHLSSALALLDAIVKRLENEQIPADKIALLGFSQGACLATQYALNHPKRYGGVIGLSGGLIGPPGTTWEADGSMEDSPVFLGCSDVDFHIPKERVEETAEAFRRAGADVTMRLYPGMGHTVNRDELAFIEQLMAQLVS